MKELLVSKKMSTQSGSALLEAIIALGAVVMAVAGIAILMVSSASNAAFIQNQNQANKYAQEGMEYLKSVKNQSYTDFLDLFPVSGVDYCQNEQFQNVTADNNCSGARIEGGKYVRTVMVNHDSSNCENGAHQVSVQVSWQSGKCDVNVNSFCHNTLLRTCFVRPPNSEL